MLKGCKSVQYFITDGATPVTFTKAENSHGTRKRLHLQRTQDMQQALHNVALESPLQVASSSKKYPNFSFSSRFEVLPRVSLTYQLICIRVVGFSASGRPLQYQGRECCLFPKGLVLGLKEVHRAVMGKIEGHTCCCAPEEAGARRLAPHMCGAALVSQSVLQVLLSFHFWKRPQGQVHGLPGKTGKEWQRCWLLQLLLVCCCCCCCGNRTTFLTTTLNDGRFCVQSCCLWMRGGCVRCAQQHYQKRAASSKFSTQDFSQPPCFASTGA